MIPMKFVVSVGLLLTSINNTDQACLACVIDTGKACVVVTSKACFTRVVHEAGASRVFNILMGIQKKL
jgi:hypothetical protein